MKIFNCALGLALVATAAAAGPSGTLSFDRALFHVQLDARKPPAPPVAQGEVFVLNGSFSPIGGGSVAVASMNGTKVSATVDFGPLLVDVPQRYPEWHSNVTMTMGGSKLNGFASFFAGIGPDPRTLAMTDVKWFYWQDGWFFNWSLGKSR